MISASELGSWLWAVPEHATTLAVTIPTYGLLDPIGCPDLKICVKAKWNLWRVLGSNTGGTN